MKRTLLIPVAGIVLTLGLTVPSATAAEQWNAECRGYSPAKTVECAAAKQQPPGGVAGALAVWSCESNFGTETPHSDPYHGPFQYMTTTYLGQRATMDDLTRWFELSTNVHDYRSNIILAVGYAARNGWTGPWPNCGELAT